MSENESLFERLGGSTKLAEIIDETYARILADQELSHFFEGVPMERLRKMQFPFLGGSIRWPR